MAEWLSVTHYEKCGVMKPGADVSTVRMIKMFSEKRIVCHVVHGDNMTDKKWEIQKNTIYTKIIIVIKTFRSCARSCMTETGRHRTLTFKQYHTNTITLNSIKNHK